MTDNLARTSRLHSLITLRFITHNNIDSSYRLTDHVPMNHAEPAPSNRDFDWNQRVMIICHCNTKFKTMQRVGQYGNGDEVYDTYLKLF